MAELFVLLRGPIGVKALVPRFLLLFEVGSVLLLESGAFSKTERQTPLFEASIKESLQHSLTLAGTVTKESEVMLPKVGLRLASRTVFAARLFSSKMDTCLSNS